MEAAIRYNNGKDQWALVDFEALKPMVAVLEFGAKKYSPDNWMKGLETTKIVESLLRHVFAYLNGEDEDPESKLPHTGHILANAMFLSHMANRCYAYVPTCLAGISFETLIEIFN